MKEFAFKELRIKFIAKVKGGAGFPEDEQGVADHPLTFFKVGDLSKADQDGYLQKGQHSISYITAKRLGAFIYPQNAVVFAKVGAALLLHRFRLLKGPSCIDNNMMGLILAEQLTFPRYVIYALSLLDFSQDVNPGAVPSINAEQIKNKTIFFPSLPLQKAIANFLDRKTQAIDALIRKKERLLELLAEKRQALITEAVTKGLDPNVPIKDSGIEWLGEIPAHWKVDSLKRFSKPGRKTFTDGDWVESPFITDHGIRLIQTGNVGIGVYKDKGFRYISEDSFGHLKCTEIIPGDVLICRLDGPVGRACLVPSLGTRMITSVDNTILKPRSDIVAQYLVYLLSSPKYIKWMESICRVGGGHRLRVSRTMLGAQKVLRPSFKEQKEIVDYLNARVQSILKLNNSTTKQIAKLKEYRQALITAAVTGQIEIPVEEPQP